MYSSDNDDDREEEARVLEGIPHEHRYILSESADELDDGDTYVLGNGKLLEWVEEDASFILTQDGHEVGRIRHRKIRRRR